MQTKFVVLDYFPYSPTHVYGPFDSEAEARAYADRECLGQDGGSYDVAELQPID